MALYLGYSFLLATYFAFRMVDEYLLISRFRYGDIKDFHYQALLYRESYFFAMYCASAVGVFGGFLISLFLSFLLKDSLQVISVLVSLMFISVFYYYLVHKRHLNGFIFRSLEVNAMLLLRQGVVRYVKTGEHSGKYVMNNLIERSSENIPAQPIKGDLNEQSKPKSRPKSRSVSKRKRSIFPKDDGRVH